jgi:uroporphyrinogen decarboxylase
MLALPETDVLDALDCDVVALEIEPDGSCLTNAFHDDAYWSLYNFNGRLDSAVPQHLNNYAVEPDGTILQQTYDLRMPPDSFVFNAEHSGQAVDLFGDLPLLDLGKYRADLEEHALLTDEKIHEIIRFVRRTRSCTDRAILVAGGAMQTHLGIAAHGGMGVFPMICMMHPDYVHELHSISTEIVNRNIQSLLPEIAGDVDIILTGGGDWGTQNSLIASGDVFRTLFAPYMRVLNDEVHRIDPSLKTFIHSCGAVYDLLDSYIEDCHIDVINPVQWPAGGRGYRAWKDKVRNRASLWGGCVNTQTTLPRGAVEDIRKEVLEVAGYFAEGGGYVFNAIHNILAEIPPEKILAMYAAAREL